MSSDKKNRMVMRILTTLFVSNELTLSGFFGQQSRERDKTRKLRFYLEHIIKWYLIKCFRVKDNFL